MVLTLVLVGPPCEASSLGLTVHVVPLNADGGKTVRAHFTAIVAGSCPSLSGLCAADEDCLVHKMSLPFKGTKPGSGWCVRQWQKTVPSNYNATISLGARVNCPHHFHLSVKDLDGDRVTCRFARPDEGECLNCTQHSFIELNKEKCMLTFTGNAPAGQYFIYLMAEDLIPAPKISHLTDKPLSSVPVHLSLTVEESKSSCIDEPVSSGDTPKEDATLFVLPYQEVQFVTDFTSWRESVTEVAVVGPPELLRVGFKSISYMSSMTMVWVRSENQLPRLLPICFAANTESLQSEPRCVWLYQREMKKLPDGTVLTCGKTSMTLVLPIASMSEINLAELQLNSPTCPVNYNSTHLVANISLNGCGTDIVQSGSELVYTNVLKSVRAFTMVSRQPSLELPLACRIPGVQAKGPNYYLTMPSEEETFGAVEIRLEVHPPGEGPLANFTRTSKFRQLQMMNEQLQEVTESRSESNSPSDIFSNKRSFASKSKVVGERITELDLQVFSNCSIDRSEMVVRDCIESETEDFATSNPILDEGCTASNTTLEVVTTQSNAKVYRLDLSSVATKGSTMFVRCTVNLCIATLPADKCPSLCSRSSTHRQLVNSVWTSSYTVNSGPVSLVVTTPPPTTAAVVTTTAATTTTTVTTVTTATSAAPTIAAATTTVANPADPTIATDPTTADPNTADPNTTAIPTTSHAPERATIAAGVILATIGIFLQNVLLH
ncbi:uncharacterized protein [Clinocottus analis]|uniref:uncharacterized protein n=1 Tax=Clinocottus analis TaxID=304258 RepID=UPI0035BF0AF4